MTTITEKLTQLTEFYAQRDLLELNKSDLLDAVKVPAEVQAAQDEADKRTREYDSQLARVRDICAQEKETELAEVTEPELPAEFVKALEDARNKRAAIERRYAELFTNEIQAANSAKQEVFNRLQVQTSAIFAQVESRKREIADEFGEKAQAVDANIASLTDEIKRDTISARQSVKGGAFHAVYVKGRVTWNTDMLDGMVIAFPALEKARKVGAPSVTIRKI